jgi:adenine-specific DNA-methyltransferase
MPVKYIPYFPETIQGQAILNNFTRTQRALNYRDNEKPVQRILRGLPVYEVQKVETVGDSPNGNLLIRGECLSACAYLKEKGIQVDLVYIDPPFASGAKYAKTIYLRRNPKVAEAIAKAEEELPDDELQNFDEIMYGDIWNKEAYLNWMYENLLAIKSVMSNIGTIYVHLDWHIAHYVKILLDEVYGEDNFLNEVIWHYKRWPTPSQDYQKMHDNILIYTMNKGLHAFKRLYGERTEETLRRWKDKRIVAKHNKSGQRIPSNSVAETSSGVPLDDVWDFGDNVWNIGIIAPVAEEREDYATQKPVALLTRIFEVSSKPGMTIADFFGGSGVAAKVAYDLGCKFIHSDVGINSIQTARDRLLAAGASFDVLEIQDGVALFRNPAQTMDKLKNLIPGMGAAISVSDFWAGAIYGSKEGMMPVYLPNLLDHTQKVLDIPLMNRIVQEELPELPDDVKKAVVYFIDVEDLKALEKFIADVNATEIQVELRDLKQVLHDVVFNDIVEYQLAEAKGKYIIEFTKFVSDRLAQKIDAYNQKKGLNGGKKQQTVLDEGQDDQDEEEAKPTGPFKPIEISENGLELIELVSLDCKNSEGIWNSDVEIKIDKKGYVVLNGEKTKKFWDAKIVSEKNPLRLKVRNIAGDETIIALGEKNGKSKPKKGRQKVKT